ncbi:hypothetical protein [Paenibacillus daejeonensis]|uniref:hypothetical protein n=1 Tax=Paenibacillus daejeonensis TaxID=135193 RepID=UPI0003792693|nr:hypothetical protein [Paenibacillus daejeonensis]
MYNTHKKTVKLMLLLVVLSLAMLGCSTKEPKEAVTNAFANSMLMKSYTFSGSMQLDQLNVPPEAMGANGPEAAAIINTLKGAEISVTGAYQENPMRMEMTMNLALQGDFSMNISVPMIMTEDKMYVKIPSIPMVPMEGLAGQFIVVDLNELPEEEGFSPMTDMNVESFRKMAQDLASVVLKHYEEGVYFTAASEDELKAKPENLSSDQIVKFSVTQDNIDDFVTTLIQQVAPEILDVIAANEEYKATLQLSDAEIESARSELAEVQGEELQRGLDEMKESLVINEINTIAAIEDDYIRYQEINVNVDITDEQGQTVTIGFFTTSEYNNINEDIEFELEIPTDAIPIEELQNMGSSMQGL